MDAPHGREQLPGSTGARGLCPRAFSAKRRTQPRESGAFARGNAEGGTRTHTELPPPDFESGASTSSATSARGFTVAAVEICISRWNAPILAPSRRGRPLSGVQRGPVCPIEEEE